VSDVEVTLNAEGFAELLKGLVPVMQRAGVRAQNKARQRCPVDTGRLHSSIEFEVGADETGVEMVLGSNVEYAPFVELGTSRMAPRPFLRSSISEVIAEGLK
jgi:HK97 gp10 family phage protein